MKTRQRFAAVLAAAFILSGSFPVFAGRADRILNEAAAEPQTSSDAKKPENSPSSRPILKAAEKTSEKASPANAAAKPEDEADFPLPDEPPAFHACIRYHMRYTVIGTFSDFTPDIVRIQTLCSFDKENWFRLDKNDWNLFNLETDDEDKRYALENQPCILSRDEPLKSYILGETDCFYVKLHITKRNGLSYETQAAVIERAGLQPLPEGTQCRACFSSSIAVRKPSPTLPYRYCMFGRYQLTVSEDADAEDIAALLPETLPVEVQLDNGPDFIVMGVVECPVTWKPLTLPRLSAGESITLPDAAEEILVPGGTPVSTPLGIFQLEESLSLDSSPSTDEVELVLNVIPGTQDPTGVLRPGTNGLEMAFHHKPTGAAAIRAYVLTEGESKWTELSGLALLKEFDQPATANSGYALLLRNDQEPYRSYLAATEAGKTPTPFFIGLKIEGGIYDGRQLILAWPDIFEQLPDLPKVGGAEGNEGNAGADDKNDSTEDGQRPDLPQTPEDKQENRPAEPDTDDGHEKPATSPDTDNNPGKTDPNPDTDNGSGKTEPNSGTDNGSGKTDPNSGTDNGSGKAEPNSGTDSGSGKMTANPGGDNSSGKTEPNPDTDNGSGKTAQNPDTDGSPAKATANPQADKNPEKATASPDADHAPGKTAADRRRRDQIPAYTPEPASAHPENQNTFSAEEPISETFISEQNPNLSQMVSDTDEETDLKDSLVSALPAMQAVNGILEESVPAGKRTTKGDNRIPFLPVITIAAAGCIGTVAFRTSRCSLLHRIFEKIRRRLHR